MDHHNTPEPLAADLRADTVSGASEIAARAAEALRGAAVRLPAETAHDLATELEGTGLELMMAQPAMAPLLHVVREVVEAARTASSVAEARREAARAAELFRSRRDERLGRIARTAAKLLPKRGLVATVSSSSTVQAALLLWAGAGRRRGPGGRRRALCFESRPGGEGRALAEVLAAHGVPVTFAVDAAVERLVPECGALLIGADAIGDLGIVNKIGSTAAARAAVAHGIPVHVLAATSKLLPVGLAHGLEDPRPAREVWEGPTQVEVWNQYFESVPLALVTSIVTEAGVRSVDQIEAERARLPLPGSLLRPDAEDDED